MKRRAWPMVGGIVMLGVIMGCSDRAAETTVVVAAGVNVVATPATTKTPDPTPAAKNVGTIAGKGVSAVQDAANGDMENPLGKWAWKKDGPSQADLALADQVDDARKQFDDGLYDQAQKSVTVLLAKGSTHPLLYFLQAQLYAQRGQLTEAVGWCDRAIGTSPWWVEPRILLAQSYIKLQRLAAAETVFSDVDRLAPHSPWGPYGQGAIALMRGDRPRAVTLIDEALRRDAHHLASLKLRIDLANALKQPDLEMQLLDRYLGEIPDAAWAHARLGELALADERLEDARRSLERAYDLAPERSLAQQLAELAQRRGDAVEAKRWQQRAGTVETAEPAPAP